VTRLIRSAFEPPLASDVSGVVAALRALDTLAADPASFDSGRPAVLARAPGRLDLMGGIADYSGSLVLEWPLACATWVLAQTNDSGQATVRSDAAGQVGGSGQVAVKLDALFGDCSVVRSRLHDTPARTWAAYALGVLPILAERCGKDVLRAKLRGLTLLVTSDVPVGKGVSSSAALEVAALAAVARVLDVRLEPFEIAQLAQRVEHRIVGAPCGIMDQMTVACGVADHLVALLCQPARLEAPICLPASLAVFGIDSGVRHQVKGADYGSVRTAAFMGARVLAELAGLGVREVDVGRVAIDDPRWHGFLANVSVDEWRSFEARVPESMRGDAFLARYGGITDDVTRVDPGRTYAIRVATAHPIFEHARVRAFRDVLRSGELDEESRRGLGTWMFESHASYGACGLGSSGTDRLVAMARDAGAKRGIYGAKITGGGSGGTVAVLARADAEAEVRRVAREYASEVGIGGGVLCGSSDGVRVWRRTDGAD
jgi:galactokinase